MSMAPTGTVTRSRSAVEAGGAAGGRVVRAAVLLDDLVGDAYERAAYLVGREDLALGHWRRHLPFPASPSRSLKVGASLAEPAERWERVATAARGAPDDAAVATVLRRPGE